MHNASELAGLQTWNERSGSLIVAVFGWELATALAQQVAGTIDLPATSSTQLHLLNSLNTQQTQPQLQYFAGQGTNLQATVA